jgi:pimeloyl-ACP methyl ester carboxylesterase
MELVRGVIQTPGVMVMRVNKPGTGDSEGSCADLDFDGTVGYLRAALGELRARSDVDPARIVVLGESVGAYLAPAVAQAGGVAGVVAVAGGAPSWLERMVAFERKQLLLGGAAPDSTRRVMQRLERFYPHYLQHGATLAQLFAADPGARRVWVDDVSHNSATRHYGRPVAFHQQAQRVNFTDAIVSGDVPTLILLGEYDQYESPALARALVDAVNARRPGLARLRIFPGLNHQLERYDSAEAAFAGSDEPVSGAAEVVEAIREWLRETLRVAEPTR